MFPLKPSGPIGGLAGAAPPPAHLQGGGPPPPGPHGPGGPNPEMAAQLLHEVISSPLVSGNPQLAQVLSKVLELLGAPGGPPGPPQHGAPPPGPPGIR